MKYVCPHCNAQFDQPINFCGVCGKTMSNPTASQLRAAAGEDPLVGQILDRRYRVLEKIGEGGMGTVYKAEHLAIGKFVAVKLLLKEFSGHKEAVRRFRREAQVVSRLNHHNIVSVFDFGQTEEGALYLIMEYIQGESLGAILRRDGRLAPDRVVRITSQVCAAISEAHAKEVIHRDLKPENIMIVKTRDGGEHVKVLDFGLAKLRSDRPGAGEQTSFGNLVGTPYYMAPEQIRGEDVDGRTDIYSLGAVLYKSLCGDPPFKASSPIAVLTKHLNEKLIPPSVAYPDLGLPAALERAVMRALEKRRDDRFASAEELQKRLESALSELPETGPVPPPAPALAADSEPAPVAPGDWSWATDLRIGNRADFDLYAQQVHRARIIKLTVALTLLAIAGAVVGVGAWKGGWFERTWEREPNNTPREANRLVPGKPLQGYIGKRLSPVLGDQDWYRIKAPPREAAAPGAPAHAAARHVLRVEVSEVPNIDLAVEVHRGSRGKGGAPGAVPLLVSDNAGVGKAEVITNVRFDPPEALVLLREVPREGPGLKPTENISDAYTILATVRERPPGEEIEPNDTPSDATPADLGAPLSGWLGAKGDKDYWVFKREGREGEKINVAFTPPPRVKTEIKLYVNNPLVRVRTPLPGPAELPAGNQELVLLVQKIDGDNPDAVYALRVNRVP